MLPVSHQATSTLNTMAACRSGCRISRRIFINGNDPKFYIIVPALHHLPESWTPSACPEIDTRVKGQFQFPPRASDANATGGTGLGGSEQMNETLNNSKLYLKTLFQTYQYLLLHKTYQYVFISGM
jgi:hypothetical protein